MTLVRGLRGLWPARPWLRALWPARPWLRALLAYGPATAYVVFLFIIGSSAGLPSVSANDKLLHLLGFIPMQLLLLGAVVHTAGAVRPRLHNCVALGLSSVVGGALEIWQYFLPYRSCEFGDWVADTVGALLAAVAAVIVLESLTPQRNRN